MCPCGPVTPVSSITMSHFSLYFSDSFLHNGVLIVYAFVMPGDPGLIEDANTVDGISIDSIIKDVNIFFINPLTRLV